MRFPGLRRTDGRRRQAQLPFTIICPVCALRNEASARFCRNCGLPLGGPRDPVRGTTMRRAELPSEQGAGIATFVGLAVVVAMLGGAGFLILRGLDAGGGRKVAVSSTPRATGPGASGAGVVATPTPRDGPTPTPPAGTSGEPASTPPAVASPLPSDEPSPAPVRTPHPTRTPAATPASGTNTGFTCDGGSITDPLSGKWRLSSWRWGPRDGLDHLSLTLTRLPGIAPDATVIRLEWLAPDEVRTKYGLDKPSGDRALVLTFKGPIRIRQPLVATPALQALHSLDMEMDGTGVLRVVVGVDGNGCARLSAPGWAAAGPTEPIDLILDVKHR